MSRTAVLAFLMLAIGIGCANASVVVKVDKSAQRLSVVVDGVPRYQWPVSTARWGYNTPNGTYHPQRLEKSWFSRKYDMSPMPHSIFFAGGYAIHGSYEVSHLGRPASHGCIRLSPAHAATLFALVQNHRQDTSIVVTGEGPSYYVAHSRHRRAEPPEYAGTRPYNYRYQRPNFDSVFNSPPPQETWVRGRGYWWGN